MDSGWLAAFVVFADEQHFTRAARRLHLSQPALHAQVRKLELSLGLPLYRLRGRQVELTAAGRSVAAFGRELGERTRRFTAELAGRADDAPVVLAAGEGAYLYVLGAGIRRFSTRHPGALRLLTRDRAGTVTALLDNQAQLGVAVFDDLPDGLEARPLVDSAPVLALPAGAALARRRSIPLAALAGARLIVPPPGHALRAGRERALTSVDVPWQVAVEASGWELMLHFVRLGVGWAVVNGVCRMPPGVVARPLVGLPRTRYWLAWRRGAPPLGRAAELAEWLAARPAS
jgi:LysR family transcriptional regulator, low CO2-responsive transcriptional regulator